LQSCCLHLLSGGMHHHAWPVLLIFYVEIPLFIFKRF
jgi:hypothetical protein